MKIRKWIVLLMVFCLMASVAVAQELTPVAPEGLNYSYKFATAYFKADEKSAFMDNYMLELEAAPQACGTDDLYVALNDLARVYAPDFAVTVEGDAITLTHVGITALLTVGSCEATANGQAVTLEAAPKLEGDVLYVPVAAVMRNCFVKDVQMVSDTAGGQYLHLSLTLDALAKVSARTMRQLNGQLRGKEYGFRYLTYTIEDDPDGKVLPMRIYIPTTYDPNTPMKAILLLHGNSVSMDYWFTDTNANIAMHRPIEMYAEENGYILIAPTAYIVAGQYGDVTNIPFMDADEWVEISEEEKALRILSEKSAMTALEIVKSQYNIDEERLYLVGNSMGGKAVLFLGNKYADLFDAFVPMAMMPNVSLMTENPYPNLVGRPIFFVEGTEDDYGFDLATKNFELLKQWLPDMQHYWCPGGGHSTAWSLALPQIFEFLNSQN